MESAIRHEAKKLYVDHFDEDVYLYVKVLWTSAIIREAYKHRSEFQLMDCAREWVIQVN